MTAPTAPPPTHQLARLLPPNPWPGRTVWVRIGAPIETAARAAVDLTPLRSRPRYRTHVISDHGPRGMLVRADLVELLPEFASPAPISFAQWLAQGDEATTTTNGGPQ